MSNPYDRNGHRANQNMMSTFCMSCGWHSSLWETPCNHQSASANEYDEFGCLIRKSWTS